MNERTKRKLLKLKNNPKKFFLDMKLLPQSVKKVINRSQYKEMRSYNGPYVGLLKGTDPALDASTHLEVGGCEARKCSMSYLYGWTRPSTERVARIKHLIRNYKNFTDDILDQARDSIEALKVLDKEIFNDQLVGDEKYVLVIGQKKSNEDLTCLESKSVVIDNSNMVFLALSENPEARVIYQSFDGDVAASFFSNSSLAEGRLRIIKDCSVPPEALARVYTWDSIQAYEYLMFSVPITVFGTPFYSGWGLTDDRNAARDPNVCLSLEQLFASTFLLMCDIVCPVTRLPMHFKQGLGVVWLSKDPFFCNLTNAEAALDSIGVLLRSYSMRVLRFSENRSNFENYLLDDPKSLRQNPFGKLLFDFFEKRDINIDSLNESINVLPVTVMLSCFLFSFHYLCKYGRFDKLRDALELYGEYLERYQHLMTEEELLAYIENYGCYFKMLFGRSVPHVPYYYLSSEGLSAVKKKTIKAQASSLIQNYEYHRVDELLYRSGTVDFNLLSFVARQCGLMAQAEANGYERRALGTRIALKALASLSSTHPEHESLNRLHYWMDIDDIESVTLHCKNIISDAVARNYLEKRFSVLYDLVGFLFNHRKLELANEINQTKPGVEKLRIKNTIRMLADTGDIKDIDEVFFKHPALNLQDDYQVKLWYIQALRQKERFTEAYSLLQTLPASVFGAYARNQKYHFSTYTADLLEVLSEFAKYDEQVKQPIDPKGVAIFASSSDAQGMLCLALDAPLLLELKKQGYATISLSKGMLQQQKTGNPDIDKCHGLVPMLGDDGQVKLNWKIDIKNKVIEAEGINFYQGFYERLSVESRRYHVDFEEPNLKKLFNQLLLKSDCFLRACLEVKKTLSDKGISAYFMLTIANLAPYSIIRDFCTKHGGEKLQLVYVYNGIDYYRDESNLFSSTVTVANATKHPHCRNPHLGVKEKFTPWYAEHGQDPDVVEGIEAEIKKHRIKALSEKPTDIIGYLKKEKQKGKTIVCCFSRLLIDLIMPYDGGPAGHKDIVDWLHHTIDTAGRSEDIILLIKPHPCEVVPKVARRLREFLKDILPAQLPSNTILLGHHQPSTQELAQVLDLGLLWSGTAGYELSILGVPVMLCSYWGEFDYLIDVLSPKSREQYEEFILSGRYPEVTEEQARKAAAAMYYRCSDEVSLPLRYFSISATNDLIGFQMPDKKLFSSYLNSGDKMLEKAVKQCFN